MSLADEPLHERLFSDRPIGTPSRDWLGVTEQFIPRLARVSVEWPAEDGLVVGLYGTWGIGKSTILSLLQHHVEQRRKRGDDKYAHTYVVAFNPWFYDDHAALITSLFATLATEVSISRSDTWESAAKGFQAMGKFLSIAAQGVSLFGVGVDLVKIGSAASKVLEEGGALATLLSEGEVKLRHAKKDVEGGLHEIGAAGGRILILLDEVDRLELPELLNLLRLVRIVADLPFVTLVAAMDEHRVRAMLRNSEHVGGEEYLDKFVQVPVRVPLPSTAQLGSRLVEQIKASAEQLGVPVTKEMLYDSGDTGASVVDLLLDCILTPRHLARFLNSFRVLLLSGEDLDLNITDAALVEALHVFYPEAYERVRMHRELLTREESTGARVMRIMGNQDPEAERRSKLYSWVLYGASGPSGMPNQVLPQMVEKLFGNVLERGPVSRLEATVLAAERRVRSPGYFDRYFLFQRTPGDLTRREVSELLQQLAELASAGSPPRIADRLIEQFTTADWGRTDQLLKELSVRLDELPLDSVEQIGHGVVQMWERVSIPIARRLFSAVVRRLSSSEDSGFRQSAEAEMRSEKLLRSILSVIHVEEIQQLLNEIQLDRLFGLEGQLKVSALWVTRVESWLDSSSDSEAVAESTRWEIVDSAMAHAFSLAASGHQFSSPCLVRTAQHFLSTDPGKMTELAQWVHYHIGPGEFEPKELIQTVFGNLDWLSLALQAVVHDELSPKAQVKYRALKMWLTQTDE